MTFNDRPNTNKRITEDKKKNPTLRIFNNFCHPTFGTFAKAHKPTHNPSFAKEPNSPPAFL